MRQFEWVASLIWENLRFACCPSEAQLIKPLESVGGGATATRPLSSGARANERTLIDSSGTSPVSLSLVCSCARPTALNIVKMLLLLLLPLLLANPAPLRIGTAGFNLRTPVQVHAGRT